MIGPALGMTAGCVAGWIGAVLLWGPGIGWDVGLGLLGPLVSAVATRGLIVQTMRVAPERLTARMIGAFAGKLVFFGAYVALAVRVLGVHPIGFALSFTVAFLALHGVEAMMLRRALVRLPPAAPSAPRVE